MKRRKKVKFSKRLKYAATWLQHPGILGIFFAITLCAVLSLGAISPCGKASIPSHGVCSNDSSVESMFKFFIILGIGTGLAACLYIMFESPLEKRIQKSLYSHIKDRYKKWPKWRRRWYPITFFLMYILIGALVYIFYRGSGLRWYHYTLQYGLVIPFFATWIAHTLLNKIRSLGKKQ